MVFLRWNPSTGTAMTLDAESLFGIANTVTLVLWIGLVTAGPRPWLGRMIGIWAIGLLGSVYSALILTAFADASAGDVSLAAVQQLFRSPAAALAGWLHYLAFDLLIGGWVARRATAQGLSRLVRAPFLVLVFMFGPFGLLLFAGAECATRTLATRVPAGSTQ
jgi:hypothetical protein